MDVQNKSYPADDVSLQIFDQCSYPSAPVAPQRKTSSESITVNKPLKNSAEPADENNDSSTSTTTNRSIHLPVEKQRGLSEIIRKRNSRSKVEDYKRSIQKSNTYDDEPYTMSKSDQDLAPRADYSPESPSATSSKSLNKAFSVDVPINVEHSSDNRAQMSIERLNVLLSNEELRDMANGCVPIGPYGWRILNASLERTRSAALPKREVCTKPFRRTLKSAVHCLAQNHSRTKSKTPTSSKSTSRRFTPLERCRR